MNKATIRTGLLFTVIAFVLAYLFARELPPDVNIIRFFMFCGLLITAIIWTSIGFLYEVNKRRSGVTTVVEDSKQAKTSVFVVFRNTQPPISSSHFAEQIAKIQFPEHATMSNAVVEFHVDPDIPENIQDYGLNQATSDYAFGFFTLVQIMKELGLPDLNSGGLGKEFDFGVAGYTDKYGGRGIVYAIYPK